MHPRADPLTGRNRPAFVARRQQHAHFTATTALHLPAGPGVSAGLVAFQNESHYFFLGVRRHGAGAEVFLERAASPENTAAAQTVAQADLPSPAPDPLELRITGDRGTYSFSYAVRPGEWRVLKQDEDGTILSTRTAGGFVGTMLGPYARRDP
jgi:alpha-N-arabinofuranosidase